MKLALWILAFLGCESAVFYIPTQEAILKIHNDLRSTIAKGNLSIYGKIQSPAANMLKMKWDESLELSAQSVANICRESPSGTPGIGENIRTAYTSPSNTLDEMGLASAKLWRKTFEGDIKLNIASDGRSLWPGTEPATQMAWATTEFVGCGVGYCGSDKFRKKYKFSVVCHYKEPGNNWNLEFYQGGDACSACPCGFKCD